MRVPTVSDSLGRAPLFAHLPGEKLDWISSRGEEVRLPAGAAIAHQGDPPDGFYVVLEGETEWTRNVAGQDAFVVALGEGSVFAELILLLDAPYPTTGRAATDVRLLKLAPDAFWEMLAFCPEVTRGIFRTAAERSGLHESVTQQQEKLAALGQLSAGLAHELNNPASAARRAAGEMRASVAEFHARALTLNGRYLTEDQVEALSRCARAAQERAASSLALDPLELGDLEDEMAAWLEDRGIEESWDLAPTFAGAGLGVGWLEGVSSAVDEDSLGDALYWLGSVLTVTELVGEIEGSTGRISELVGAVKAYTHMDRATLEEVDVREGLESTLKMLAHKLKGLKVTRDYALDLPTVPGHPGELNQVWTNLLDNAADAANAGTQGEAGGERGAVSVSARRNGDAVLVEVADDGPGVPQEVRPHVFEPFFTTKPFGEGTGLGLDISHRLVVESYGGELWFESEPGETRFLVRLPMDGPKSDGSGGHGVIHDPQDTAVFPKLAEEEIAWLSGYGEELELAAGDYLFMENDTVDSFYVLLEGELRVFRPTRDGDEAVATHLPGEFTGQLAVLAGTVPRHHVRAVVPSRVLEITSDAFRTVSAEKPEVAGVFISALSRRVRENQDWARQNEKLAALGKLSAGLAHELNNPASAARRAASSLRAGIQAAQEASLRNDGRFADSEKEKILALQRAVAEDGEDVVPLDALEQSDREDELVEWLEGRGVEEAWELGPMLAGAGVDADRIEAFAEGMEGEVLAGALGWLGTTLDLVGLVGEVEGSTGRISELVHAMKEYSFMDRAPAQEVDVHEGVESTLVILGHKLKGNVEVVREYDPALPRVPAHGGELNQVWTNLIDNAIDAMSGNEGVGHLEIKTSHYDGWVTVEVTDDGPGIPRGIRGRIFEPFFTTKAVGEGTGLGLDIARRIVTRRHGGDMRVDSKPGRTRFSVRLPVGSEERDGG